MSKHEEMIEVRCPCDIIERNNKVFHCNQLLCYASKGSIVNTHCRKCKHIMTFKILENGNIKFKVQENEYER